MAEIITHAFVSAKTQSPDTTLVSKNEWNDGHIFSGGINGQVLLYDNTQLNNMRWTDGLKVYSAGLAIPNPTTSPATNIATINFTCNSPVIAVIAYTVRATTTGAVAYTAEIYVDSILEASIGLTSGDTDIGLTKFINLNAGAHSLFVRIASVGNANFTGGAIQARILTAGV